MPTLRNIKKFSIFIHFRLNTLHIGDKSFYVDAWRKYVCKCKRPRSGRVSKLAIISKFRRKKITKKIIWNIYSRNNCLCM